MRDALIPLFSRDLTRLHQEISAYPDDASLWQVSGGVTNSAGNLCLHLVGNLNTFVGAILGKTGYVRDREAEFSLKNIPKQELLAQIEDVRQVVDTTLRTLSDEELEGVYPSDVRGHMTTPFFLIHLLAHLSYHLGQIDYHRRLLAEGKRVELVES